MREPLSRDGTKQIKSKELQLHLCSYEVMKAVHVFEILGHDDSLSPVALGGLAHVEQSVGGGGLHLDGTRRGWTERGVLDILKNIRAATIS